MLLRMIGSISRWDRTELTVNRPNPTIWGDAISDLRTKKNTLSVWLANSEEEIEIAVVALALGRDEIQKITYVLIDEQDLRGIEIETSDENEGEARGLDEHLLKNHRDLVEIDHKHIGLLAEYIERLTIDKTRWVTVTKPNVKKYLNKYKENIDLQNMNTKLKNELGW